MSDKIAKKLNIGERFGLFQFLPPEGDLVTYKEVRKLKETLNPSDQENQEYEFKYGFRCPHRKYNEDGKAFQCEFEETAEIAPRCPVHDVLCVTIGTMFWKPEMAGIEKEIWLNKTALKIITEALRKARDNKKVNDANYSLFIKFGIKEKDEE